MADITPANSTVVGYFSSERSAEAALRALQAAGFIANQIGVACHQEPAITVKTPEPGFWHRTRALFGGGDNPEPIRTGAVQPLSTGEVAGPETSGGFEMGNFHKTLTGLKLPEARSRRFSEMFERDKEGVLITVDAGSRRSEAESILLNHGCDLGEAGRQAA